MNRFHSLTSTLAIAMCVACGSPDAGDHGSTEAPGQPAASGNFRGRIYERNFVFTTLTGDSAFMVPWLTTSRTRPGGVDRAMRGLLGRGNAWEPFYDERWETAPSRAPWRVLPHQSLRLVVGEGDAVEGLLFSEGPRQLDLELSSASLIEWTGTQGQSFRLVEAAAYVGDQRVTGLALDMARVHGADETAHGDWAFLISGDSLQLVLEDAEPSASGPERAYRGWGRLDFRDLQWPTLAVAWSEVRAFQPARQDIPVSWTLRSEDGDVEGELSVASAHVQAGEGPGPLLPVDALFFVEGSIVIEGASYPVRGLFRHTRP